MAEDANGALLNGARGLAIPLSVYRDEFGSGALEKQSSWNFGPLARGCDLWNGVNRYATIKSIAQNIEWAKWSLTSQRDQYGHQGHEWGPWESVYARYHVRSWRCIRAVALIVGDDDLVDLCDSFLRESALLGALLAVPWRASSMSEAEREKNGPNVWEAKEGSPEPKQMRGLLPIGQAGYRYAVDRGGLVGLDAVYFGGSVGLMDSLGLAVPRGMESSDTIALRERAKRHGGAPLAGWPLLYESNAGELGTVCAAAKKESREAVVACGRLLSWPAWGDVWIEVTSGGVANVIAEFAGSSTPAMEFAAIFKPGVSGATARQVWAAANPLRRKSGADDLDVAATRATIDWPARSVTVGRLDGRYPAQTAVLPGGDEWLRVRLRPSGVEIAVPGSSAPPSQLPPTNDQPRQTKRRSSWIERTGL